MKRERIFMIVLLSSVILSLTSCIFKKKTDWCSTENLLKDTLLFKNPGKDVLIDEKYCESFTDYAICIKGRIENKHPLQENIRIFGIDHVDSLKKEMTVGLGPLSGASDWFDPIALKKNSTFYKYDQFLPHNTHKWVYIRDGELCDTFYVVLINM